MIRTLAAFAVLLTLALAGCATPTPYQPLAANNPRAGGFTDQKLDESHFRVSFQGNWVTSRERVENYLLYRAAELAVSQGFDWFEMVSRDTTNHQTTLVQPGAGFYGGGYWAPYWRFHGGWGWGGWDPYFDGDYNVTTYDHYQATADIVVGHAPKPADPGAFDARQVMANLGPTIVKPS
jgi:hypothetical protein